jgi:hypothetical protein
VPNNVAGAATFCSCFPKALLAGEAGAFRCAKRLDEEAACWFVAPNEFVGCVDCCG